MSGYTGASSRSASSTCVAHAWVGVGTVLRRRCRSHAPFMRQRHAHHGCQKPCRAQVSSLSLHTFLTFPLRLSVVGSGSWVVSGRRSLVVDEVVGRRLSVVGHGSWVVGRGSWSWVVGRGSWVAGGSKVVGRVGCRWSLVVGRGSWVVGRAWAESSPGSWLWVMGCGSWVVGRRSWVVGHGSWVVVVGRWTWVVGGLNNALLQSLC